MDTIYLKTDVNCIDEEVIAQGARILREGGLVAFPTETVYGLGGDALRQEASSKIYQAKGRPSDNPLIVHISRVEDIYELAENVPETAIILAEKFWPGPLTMILKKRDNVPDSITGGLDSVAIRMPDNPVALRLIEKSGVFVAAPSANLSGRPSPTTGEHVLTDLGGRIDMIIDAGQVNVGIESTIVDLTEAVPTVLRPGYITLEDLREVLGEAKLDKGIEHHMTSNVAPKAPGMKYKHYAPKGELTLVEGDAENVIQTINELVEKASKEGHTVAIMAAEENLSRYRCDIKRSLGKGATEAAHYLYGWLREFDDLGVEYIYSEGFEEAGVGQAVMNRMVKAAGHRMIRV